MNATGESDLQNYYDYVNSQREAKLRPVLECLLPIMAVSAWALCLIIFRLIPTFM